MLAIPDVSGSVEVRDGETDGCGCGRYFRSTTNPSLGMFLFRLLDARVQEKFCHWR